MNHTYRLVWNAANQRYIPAPETARGRGKSSSRKALQPAALVLSAALALPGWAQPPSSTALPSGGQVVAGQAQIGHNGSHMTIQQASDKAILQWNRFDIGSNASVQFQQPNSGAVALNRVAAGEASHILGQLSANGQVWLVNPHGVVFGNGSKVDVGGLVASTLHISNDDFLRGHYRFSRDGASGSIVNQGQITALGDGAQGGLIALLAPTVRNDGVLRAQLGNVALAAGEQITLQAGANGLLQLQLDPATVRTLVENRQLIVADGGQVLMTGRAADALAASVVANTGTVQARSVQEKAGRILLLADAQWDAPSHSVTSLGAHGTVQVGGLLDASAPNSHSALHNSGNGGFIETSAAQVQVADNARVTTLAHSPGARSGTWLIDPTDFTISAGTGASTSSGIGADTLAANLQTSHITLQTDASGGEAGDILVNAPVSYNTHTLTLQAHNDIHINAAITAHSGGGLTLQAGNAITATASVEVGTFTLQGGHWRQTSTSLPGFSATDFRLSGGSWVRASGGDGSSANPYQIADVYGLQGMGTQLGAHYALAGDIDASGTAAWNSGAGWLPVGPDSSSSFTGSLDGGNHTVTGLTINRPSGINVGLFGHTGSASHIQNIGLVGGSVLGSAAVGSLVGFNNGSISHAYATTNVTGESNVGGLIGKHSSGTTSQSYATGTVTATTGGVGGLVGSVNGTISHSYASGSVSGGDSAGGLAGASYSGDIKNSYATGNVSGTTVIGGLVGVNDMGGSISSSFSTGSVSGTGSIGGLTNSGLIAGTVSNSFYATTDASSAPINNSGSTTGDGGKWYGNNQGTGKTYAQLMAPSTFSGWDSGAWTLPGGDSVAGYETGLPALSGVTPAADVVRSTLFASGMGTPLSPYTITDWQQLAHINQVLAGNYNYTLNNHLDSTSTGYTLLASSTAHGGLGWNPLGSASQAFTGTFDGQSHTISGLTINRPSQDNVGLFGLTSSSSVIRNLGLLGGSVTGRYKVGMLVGQSPGSITQTYATGTVTGEMDVGGLGGINGGTITQSHASGNINGSNSRVGGLVGMNDGTIRQAYATGNVSGDYRSGGLVGENSGSIIQSYATGNVVGSHYVGGLVGGFGLFGGSIDQSYATGSVSGASYVGGLVGHVLAGASVTNSLYATTDASGGAINNGGSTTGDGGKWTGNNLGTGKTYAQLMAPSTFSGWDSGIWTLPGGDSVAGYETGLPALSGVTPAADVVRSTLFASGMGTPLSPYTITDWQQLAHINQVLAGNYNYTLNNHLDSTSTGYTLLASSTAHGGLGWNPLGSSSQAFTGTFDGQSHTISGLTINRPSHDNVGLFGLTSSSSVIRNLGLLGGSVTGRYQVGMLAGKHQGSINQSYASGTVTGKVEVGGLVGKHEGTITHSYASGNVSGTDSSVGGLVGLNDKGTIRQAYATGNVSGGIASGGLVGSNSGSISQSYATGNVLGSYNIGGLLGRNDTGGNVNQSYATGSVSGDVLVGGLIGLNSASNANNSFYATTDASGGAINNGGSTTGDGGKWTGNNLGTGKTYSELMTPSTFSGWGSDLATQGGSTAVWRIYDGLTTPLLRNFLTATTVTADLSAAGKTYDGTAASGNASYTTSPSVSLLGTLRYASQSANAGIYTTAAGTLSLDGLYALQQGYDISYAPASLTIGQAALQLTTITGGLTGLVLKTYDGTTQATLNPAHFVLTGWLGSDGATVTQTTGHYDSASAGSGKTVTVNLSTNDYLATGTTNLGNYVLPTQISAEVGRIDKAALTVTASDAHKTVDGQAWHGGNGVSYQGFVAGESAAALSGTLAYAGTAQGAVDAGSYQITPQGLHADNYAITYRSGTLTVAALPGGTHGGEGNTGGASPGEANPGSGGADSGNNPGSGFAKDHSMPSSGALWHALTRGTTPTMRQPEDGAAPTKQAMALLTLAPCYIQLAAADHVGASGGCAARTRSDTPSP